MSRALSYADAVRILSGQTQVLAVLDRAAGGFLLAATGGGSELVHLVAGRRPEGERLGDLARALLHSEVPMPAPHQPYEQLVGELEWFYRRLSDSMVRFLAGLASWDRPREAERAAVTGALHGAVVERAPADYEVGFRRRSDQLSSPPRRVCRTHCRRRGRRCAFMAAPRVMMPPASEKRSPRMVVTVVQICMVVHPSSSGIRYEIQVLPTVTPSAVRTRTLPGRTPVTRTGATARSTAAVR